MGLLIVYNMENSTSSALTLINNFANQAILNFNPTVTINLFFYSAATTFGVLVTIKLLDGFVSFIRYKWTSRYERRAEEIKELNNKMHDRLVEIGEAIECGKKPEDYIRIKTRLRYNASRLKKYDKTIFKDVDSLLNTLSSNQEGADCVAESKDLIEQIREKVDKLLYKKS